MKHCNLKVAIFLFIVGCEFTLASPSAPTDLRILGASRPSDSIYIGVPRPDGVVPDAIMPTLPTANSTRSAFPYDPISLSVPSWNDAVNQYWVDNGAGNCSDLNNSGRGSKSEPRCTLPGFSESNWFLNANDQIFVVGNGSTYTNPNSGRVNNAFFPGSANEPIWIIGVNTVSTPRWTNQPKLTFEPFIVGGIGQLTHTIWHNVHFYSATDQARLGLVSSVDADDVPENLIEYVVFKSVTISGAGTFDGEGKETNSGGAFIIKGNSEYNPVQFVVIEDSDIFGMGRWIDDNTVTGGNIAERPDVHGVQLLGATRYFWYLNNRSYHLQGDNIQCSTSNQFQAELVCPVVPAPADLQGCSVDLFERQRPHYVYIAGNDWYENLENAYDSKGCYHVVFSENRVHDFTHKNIPPNNNAITTSQDEESFAGDIAWFLNNKLYGNGSNFAYKSTTEDAQVYVLGNLVVDPVKYSNSFITPVTESDQSDQFIFRARCQLISNNGAGIPLTTCPEAFVFAMNTVDCNGQGAAFRAPIFGGRISSTIDTGPFFNPGDEDQNLEITGNIFKDCQDAPGSTTPHDWRSDKELWTINYNYNVDYRTSDIGQNYTLDDPFFDSRVGNKTSVDPLFVNPNDSISGDYSLSNGSPAKRLVGSEPIAYQIFRDMYGLDIRKDIEGKVWRAGALLNSGAYQ